MSPHFSKYLLYYLRIPQLEFCGVPTEISDINGILIVLLVGLSLFLPLLLSLLVHSPPPSVTSPARRVLTSEVAAFRLLNLITVES
jgi:hypothetical protein